jgi:DNA polymerase/3'-5' exonuclease PolX
MTPARSVAGTPVENIDIAKVFEEVADLLEIQGANQFRVRASRTAGRTVETLGVPCASLAKSDPKALERYPGIAKDLAGKICEIVETGSLALLRELTAPAHLLEAADLANVSVAAPHSTMREMVEEADRHLLVVIKEMRHAAKVADEHGDPGTVDLFSRVVQVHEKHEWWMRDLLRAGDGLCT